MGVTLFAAAGDNGSADDVQDGYTFATFPAASPYAVSVGGTTLETTDGAWSGSASGTTRRSGTASSASRTTVGVSGRAAAASSAVDGVPTYQSDAGLAPTSANPAGVTGVGSGTGRGVPDVAADADPSTGYKVWAYGERTVVGGTSGATPLWASLLGLIEQNTGKRMGWLTPLLYDLGVTTPSVYHDITRGDNVTSNVPFSPYPAPGGTTGQVLLPTRLGYSAGPGFDLASGWGSPQGTNLMAAIRALLGDLSEDRP